MEIENQILKDDNDIENKKINDKNYLRELQRFLDLADNIPDESLRKNIIYQMLKCDRTITDIFRKNI